MFRRRKRIESTAGPVVVTAETIAHERELGLLSRVTVVPPSVVTPASLPTFWAPQAPLPTAAAAATAAAAEAHTAPTRRDCALELPDGRLIPLASRHTVIGRVSHSAKPQPHDTHVVGLPDPDRSLSRSHARIERDDTGQLWLRDLGSGNGSIVVSAQTGRVHECAADIPIPIAAGDVLSLGPYELRVRRDRRTTSAAPGGEPGHPSSPTSASG